MNVRLRLLASLAAFAAGVVAVIIVALLLAPLARADGDPASDWLLQRSLFVPPDAGISKGDQQALTSLLQSAKAQGYTLHVAVIATRYDMGAVTVLFKRPTDYAPFLSQEVRFIYRQRVLVVMPNGFAIANNGKRDPAEQQVVAKLQAPKPFHGAALTAAVENAVRKLAAAQGIVLPNVPVAASGSNTTTRDRILIGVGAGLLVLVALGVSYWRRRRKV
ncbi:MAG TPA: hypothetical protein VGU02_10715 [Gaiellaceae bacterium]|nr:hypothetical protein [Gaiellaceae bacterium]